LGHRTARLVGCLIAAVALLAGWLSAAPSQAAQPQDAPGSEVCANPHTPGRVHCHARHAIGHPAAGSGVSGFYSPADLQSAYKLLGATAGGGQTVAIIDAFDDPNAESDLGVYRSQYGLSACTTANNCFRKVDQRGSAAYPSADRGWAQEISIDLDMVSAICPRCHLLLVEADDALVTDLGQGVNTAVALGATEVSNSYGGPEWNTQEADVGADYNHRGVPITVSSGDNGYGVEFPASSPNAVAVGGTSLQTASDPRGWSETAWSGAGSGCSAYEAKPTWQVDSGCPKRTVADVSAVADTRTAVSVYDSYHTTGWTGFGGTSVSAPIIAGIYALSGSAANTGASAYYSSPGAVFDVVSGSNGSCGGSYLCTALPGFDGPTGLGAPNGVLRPTFSHPTNGATGIDYSLPFTWSSASGAQAYDVYLGTTQGGNDIADSGGLSSTSWTPSHLPAGTTVWARLWTEINNTWRIDQDISFSTAMSLSH
jgi:hypothetical protein